MKRLLTAMICLATLSSFAQTNQAELASGKAPYTLNVPQGWTVQRSVLTGKVSDDGAEDLRLSPGYNNPTSEDYWTYASLWSVPSTFNTDAESIKNSLNSYYMDLLIKNIKKYKVPAKKILQVKTWLSQLESEQGDLKTYYGAIAMLDYKTQLPISLNCVVHVRACPGQTATFIFYELSPKPLSEAAWKNLDQLWSGFECVSAARYGAN